jgi:hypothetical protein
VDDGVAVPLGGRGRDPVADGRQLLARARVVAQPARDDGAVLRVPGRDDVMRAVLLDDARRPLPRRREPRERRGELRVPSERRERCMNGIRHWNALRIGRAARDDAAPRALGVRLGEPVARGDRRDRPNPAAGAGR